MGKVIYDYDKFDNRELINLMKKYKVGIAPSWTTRIFYVRKMDIRSLALKEKIEWRFSETTFGRKVILLRN